MTLFEGADPMDTKLAKQHTQLSLPGACRPGGFRKSLGRAIWAHDISCKVFIAGNVHEEEVHKVRQAKTPQQEQFPMAPEERPEESMLGAAL
jgi:hypothetical protein